ncbi:MAG: MATE family efflux transporter [Cellulosilyticaceae bacterium]
MTYITNKKQWITAMMKDKAFLATLVAIAVPIVVQNLISSSLNMIDTLMIGRVGQEEIAAVGLANQLFMLIMLGLTGICAGSGIFISQYWGKKDTKNIKKMLGLALVAGVIYSLVVTVLVQLFPTACIAFFNKEPRILTLGTDYLKMVSISYVFTAITFAYSFSLRSIGRTKLPMVASGVAVAINIVGNAVFIFGLLGVPAMGVVGAALATLIARIVESIIIVAWVYIQKYELAGTVRELFIIPKELVQKSFVPTMSIIANELCWGLGAIVYTKAYGYIGSEAVTTIQIANTVTNFFLVVIFAMASAALTIVGNAIGEGDHEKAKLYSRRIVFISLSVGIILCLGIAVTAPLIVMCFKVTPNVSAMTIRILLINALILIPRIYNIIMIIGIFRGGGDTVCSVFLEAGTMWLIGVPLSFLGAYVWGLRLEYVVALLMMEEVVKGTLCLIRFRTNKWIHDVVKD